MAGTVTISGKTYSQDYANNPTNQEEMRLAVVNNKGKITTTNDQGNSFDNVTGRQLNSVVQQPQYQQSQPQQPQQDIQALINQQATQQKAAMAAQLQGVRDQAVNGYNQKIGGLQGTYQPLRDSQDFQAAKALQGTNESYANMGIANSGDMVTSQIQNRVGNENSLNAINTQQQGDKTNFENLIANANNSYNSDLASSNANIDAQALQNLINQSNSDRSFNYQSGRDTIGDNRYNAETSYNQGRDALTDNRYNQSYDDQRGDINYDRQYQNDRNNVADTGMMANGKFTQQGQTNDLNIQVQQAQLKEMQDPMSTTNQMAKLGLDTAKLNFAYLPQQLKDQAAQIAQQLSKGVIDIKTAQTQLNYLPQQLQSAITGQNLQNAGQAIQNQYMPAQMQAGINAQNASAAAAGRSNQGGGGGGGTSYSEGKSGSNGTNGTTAQQLTAAQRKSETTKMAVTQEKNGTGLRWLEANAKEIKATEGTEFYHSLVAKIQKTQTDPDIAYQNAKAISQRKNGNTTEAR